ncbi:hypothetical protein UPYG_G00157230 [Umbra pygmaea]|uniref:Uncharacterized protein n=1 Tax=Umbra pygmaea TaxID=75934 RepID=A0ABD0WYH0_UMBPY
MRYTFYSDECMVINIPLGSLRDAKEGQLMPEKFHCVFKDVYKVFLRGQPKALGAAQIIAGVLVLILGCLQVNEHQENLFYILPGLLFVAAGLLTYGAGHSPNIFVTKLSFSFNIISFFGTVGALVFCCITFLTHFQASKNVPDGVRAIIATLLVIELVISLVLIYLESKAVCRQHFNVLPMVTLKQDVSV